MTDQEVHILLTFLKRNHPQVYQDAMNHVKEYTDFIEYQTAQWMALRVDPNFIPLSMAPPSLSKLNLGEIDDELFSNDSKYKESIIEAWLSSPTPCKTDQSVLNKLAENGFI